MATRTYLLPQVIVQQDFASLPASATQSLLAVIVGPRKSVRDIEDPNDASYVSYGALNTTSNTTYTLKGVESLDVVDKGSITLSLKNVFAQYANLTSGITGSANSNVLTLGSNSFVYYPGYSRNSSFVRDVQVGDGLVVTDGTKTVTTKVTGFTRAMTGGSIASPTSDAANKVNASATSATVTQVNAAGTSGHAWTSSASSYTKPIELGAIADNYYLECTTAGSYAVSRWKITSDLGDNVSNVVGPANSSTAINIGTRGLTATAGTGDGNFALGEKYKIAVSTQFTDQKPALASGVTIDNYAGTIDTIYEVRVVKGGTWAQGPQVAVTTTNGIDSSAPQSITSSGASFLLGSLGLSCTFTSTNGGLCLNDVFYFAVTAKVQGNANKLSMADVLPTGISTLTSVKFAYSADSITVPRAGYPTPNDTAWTISTDGKQVTLNSLVYVSHPDYVSGGAALKMPVLKGDVYYGYEALKTEGANELNSISEASLISSQIGKLVPENPVAYGVYKALQNSSGSSVMYVPVAEDTLNGYIQAFDSTTYESSAYYIVPMTNDAQVIQALKSHVVSASDESKARERIGIVNPAFSTTQAVYGLKSDNTPWTGYIELSDTPVAGRYDKVTIPGATFIDSGIKPGDYVRSNYSVDALGNETYGVALVASVVGQEVLLLQAPGFSVAVGDRTNSIKRRIEVGRSLSKTQQAQAIAASSEALGSRRVVSVWPDVLLDGSTTIAGYYGAAAVAGLKSGVAPHQPLTNVTLTGFTSASRSTPYFTMDQLNTIAGGGTWIIDQAIVGSSAAAEIYNRHQLTTDYTDDNMAEVSITTNLDSISKILREDLKAFIGQYNNHPYFMQLLKTRLVDRLTFLQGNTVTLKAGPQLLGFTIVSLAADPNIRTRIIATIDLTLPYPVNVIQIKLNVI